MATWRMVEEIGTSLPETTVGHWYGQPALVVAGKGLIHLGDHRAGDGVMAVPSPEKDDLLLARPDAYFETDHHRGTPWLLVRLAKVSKAELRELLTDAWRMKASAAVRKAHPDV